MSTSSYPKATLIQSKGGNAKYFSFNSANLRKNIPVARQWSFAAEEVKENGKVLFIYDSDTYENNDLKIILSILGKNARTTRLSEASEVLQAYI